MSETAQQREIQDLASPLVIRLGRTRQACALLLLAGTLSTSGCFFSAKKKAKVFTPPPVYANTTPPPANPKPIELSPPLDVDTAVDPGMEPVVAGGMPALPPAPPRPAPVKPAPVKPAPPVVEVVPPPVIASPKPTTIFSAEERRQMNQEIDQRLDRVRKALARVEGRTNLSAELAGLANQARNFMMNTEQTRVQDLVTAVSLAQRADFYAMELVQRLP
jgi:hypothetical protein